MSERNYERNQSAYYRDRLKRAEIEKSAVPTRIGLSIAFPYRGRHHSITTAIFAEGTSDSIG